MAPHVSTKSAGFSILWLCIALYLPAANAVKCPHNCKCAWVLDSLEVDCSSSGLISYPDFTDIPIERLDLSNNFLVEFPKQLAAIESLIYLDLSNNQIQYIDSDALVGFASLRTLRLANNSIKGWASINPNEAFRNAFSLKRLNLNGNQLGSFTNDQQEEILISESLTELELKSTSLTVVGGDMLITALPKLERLVLSNNPINKITTLPSKSLRVLELENCNLQLINSGLLQGLPSLEVLNLSWNAGLLMGSKLGDMLTSHSLTTIDASFCNLDDIDLSGFPALTTVRLRGNLMRNLSPATFGNNSQLETIDLSRNSLRVVEVDAFTKLKRLTTLDLSYNEIARLDRNVFRSNDLLVTLNLSRNVLDKFTKLVSNSLRDINLSWCEIIVIEITALSGLTSIQSIDLSNNLLRDFPGGMRSETLQRLNLSNCRLSNIRNNTFSELPELAHLRLNGNRFTNPFPVDVFRANKYLDQIWLGDNPWICNCVDVAFIDFYDYLTAVPPKLKDKNNVRCASPSYQYGRLWEGACGKVWSPNARTSDAEKAWSMIMMCIMVIGAIFFLLVCFRKYMKDRQRRLNHREYRENQQAMLEVRRQNQRMLEEEGAPNAPNAFEMTLPSYEDALRMPKLERPVKSMLDLTGRERKRLQRSKTDPEGEGDIEDTGLILDDRQRFRSEEMLSNRDKERTLQIGPYRRTGYTDYNISGSRHFNVDDSRFPAACVKSQNLQSAEQIGNFQSYENSPYSKRKPKIAEIPPFKRATLKADSVEFLTDPEFDVNSKPGSPFARRKPKNSISEEVPTHQSTDKSFYANIPLMGIGSLAPAVEDYFGGTQNSPSSSIEECDFQIVVEPEVNSMADNNMDSESSYAEMDVERSKRKKRKNSTSRRASGNFTAAAAAAAAEDSSSSEKDPIVVVHMPMRETLF